MSKPAACEHGRGEIRDNAIKALVTSKLFQTKVVKAKKGKGSYNRRGRNSQDYALVFYAAMQVFLLIRGGAQQFTPDFAAKTGF